MKRLKKTVQSKNTTRKKNNGGMTYVELLVALSLLVLIVTMFSPLLLSSYDRIYRAGEITSDAFDSRQDLEKGLSSREDHEILGVEAKFASNTGILANKIYIMAKRVVSSFDGLETLYVGGKGKIEIVNNEDGLVKDNQSSHIIRLKLTNLAYKDYDVIKDSAVIEQLNKGNVTSLRGKVRFYVCSIFDTATALEGEVVRKPNFKQGDSYAPYCDLRIDNVDITKSPLKIVAYYLNEYGSVKEATTYLTIEKSDVIFVGETSSEAQYFTLSDAGSFDAAVPVIAGRKMETAPIPAGKTLTDVAFIEASGAGGESYFSMCGEDGIARRLWHLTDANASTVSALDGTAINNDDPSRITFKSQALNGNQVYFQYDWAGDMTDLFAHSAKSGRAGCIDYGSGSTSDVNLGENYSDYIWKNEYNVDNSYLAYNLDGYNSGYEGGSDFWYSHRRISYILSATETELAAAPYNTKKQEGYIIRKDTYAGATYNRGTSTGEGQGNTFVFRFDDGQWYTYGKSWGSIGKVTARGNYDGCDFWGLNKFHDDHNAQVRPGQFVVRNSAANKNNWATSGENASYEGGFEKLAYVYLQSYNTISPDALLAGSVVEARNNTQNALVNFTSCISIPGTIESLYLGTVDAYGIINQTTGIIGDSGNSGWSTDQGIVKSYVFMGENGKTYQRIYNQMDLISDFANVMKQGGVLSNIGLNPEGFYGRTQYSAEREKANNSNVHLTWSSDNNPSFTLGYCSDLYTMYSSLAVRDMKPLESVYAATYNKSDTGDTDGDFRKNMWFPREFLNMTESDSYGSSVVAVGYDLGGGSKMYYKATPEYTTSTNTRFLTLTGDADLDKDDDGRVDFLFGYNGNAPDLSYATVTQVKYNSNSIIKQSFSNEDGGKTCYYIDPYPDNDKVKGDDSQTFIALPQHVVISTEVDYICNSGVISVYNSGKDNFAHIGYVKGSATENVRFTSVSVDMLSGSGNNGVLGAAIGGSNGKLYFAKLTYTDSAIVETSLKWGSTLVEITNLSTYYSSIDTVKAFNLNGTFYILVGGKSANNKAYISLVTVNAGNPASSTVKHVKLAEVPYDVTDIILADKYVCFTSHQSGAGSEGCVVIGELFANGAMKNIDTVGWKFITRYHTEFESDAETGAIKAKGDGTPLPRLKALASSVPVNYS